MSNPVAAAVRAIKKHQPEQLAKLLSSDASKSAQLASAVDNSGAPLLVLAADEGDAACIRALLDAGADVNAPEQVGDRRTPLLAASWAAEAAVVGALLDAGADVTATDAEGRTTAHVLARQGETAVLEAALRHKAAGTALLKLLAQRDGNGFTPIAAAVDAQQFDTAIACFAALRAADDAEVAAAVSASLNDEPNPLLMVAADSVTAWQNGAVARLLEAALQAGADPRVVIEETPGEEEDGEQEEEEAAAPTTTPLHCFASIEAASRAFDMLLKHAAALERRDGANTDEKGWGDAFRDGANRSLLHAACDEAAVSNMRIIIDSGACRAPTAEALAADGGATHLQELRAYGENAIALVAGAQRGEQRNALKKLLDRCEEAALVLQMRGFSTKDAVKALVDHLTAATEAAAAQGKAKSNSAGPSAAAAAAAATGDYSGRSNEQLEAEKALARADVRAKIAAANRQHRDAKEARRADKADADADAADDEENKPARSPADATNPSKAGAAAKTQEAGAPFSIPAMIMALLIAIALSIALWS